MNNKYDNAPQLLKDYIVYLQLVKNRSELTVLNYYTDLRSFFRYFKIRKHRASDDPADFQKIDISDITEADIKSVDLMMAQDFLIFTKNEKDNHPKARYRKGVALRQFFKYLTNNKGLFEVNPLSNLELPTPKQALPKYLTLDESVEMLTNINTPAQKRDYCIITFFLNCGLRISELCGLDLQDIQDDALRVLGKGNKVRIVYLNDACKDALNGYLAVRRPITGRDRNALFLSTRNERISRSSVHALVKKHLSAAGLDASEYSSHKLRHTAATLMLQNGVDVKAVQEVLGHEHLNTTEIYTHIDNDALRVAEKANPLSHVKMKKNKESN